jgi:hypothetical protein
VAGQPPIGVVGQPLLRGVRFRSPLPFLKKKKIKRK